MDGIEHIMVGAAAHHVTSTAIGTQRITGGLVSCAGTAENMPLIECHDMFSSTCCVCVLVGYVTCCSGYKLVRQQQKKVDCIKMYTEQ